MGPGALTTLGRHASEAKAVCVHAIIAMEGRKVGKNIWHASFDVCWHVRKEKRPTRSEVNGCRGSGEKARSL